VVIVPVEPAQNRSKTFLDPRFLRGLINLFSNVNGITKSFRVKNKGIGKNLFRRQSPGF
jgi:hypothetical protein